MNLYKVLTSMPFSPAFELQRVKLYTCHLCGGFKTRAAGEG